MKPTIDLLRQHAAGHAGIRSNSLSEKRPDHATYMAARFLRLIWVASLGLWLGIGCPTAQAYADEPEQSEIALTPATLGRIELNLTETIKIGMEVGPKQLKATQKPLRNLKLELGDDPRLEYLVAVVQLRQGRGKVAAQHFESFIRSGTHADWPAWQAMIWGLLTDKLLDQGLERLDEYSQLVIGLSADQEVSPAQRDAAQWIGEVLSALEFSHASSKKQLAQIETAAERVRVRWNDELFSAYTHGRDLVEERAIALDWNSDITQSRRRKRGEDATSDKLRKISKRVEEISEEREQSEKTADELKKWMDDSLKEIDDRLGKLEKEYQYNEQRAQTLYKSIHVLEKEAGLLQQMGGFQGGVGGQVSSNTGGYSVDAIRAQSVYQLQVKRYLSQLDYMMSLQQLERTSQEGHKLQQVRKQVIDRFEQGTGSITRKNGELDRWEARLNQQQRKLASEKQDIKPPKATGKPVPKTLKSLVSIDFDEEIQRIYQHFGLKAPKRATPLLP